MRRVVACAAAFVLFPACQSEPPAYPSAIVEIDTDLPVPSVIGRVQVDVFSEDGEWVDSRRFVLSRDEHLPASFGVAMRDDTHATSILVRVRGYAEGAEREYRGERFFARPPVAASPASSEVATSIGDLCAKATELPPHETRVMRVGPKPLFAVTCDDLDNVAGSAAAYVTIAEPGRYRFDVLPFFNVLTRDRVAWAPTLHLARDCTRPAATIACNERFEDGVAGSASIEQDLTPGRYVLVTGGWDDASVGDVALRWSLASEWGTPALPSLTAAATPDDAAGAPLSLHRDGADTTPANEPAPDASVDRLVRIDLEPGRPAHAKVVLRGACAGTMAHLVVDGGRVDARASATCIDTQSVLVPAPSASTDETVSGRFIDEPCQADDSDDDVVCVPGGAFVLGGGGAPLPDSTQSTPARIAAVHRFFVDRREYTVADYRAAKTAGLVLGRDPRMGGPMPNDGPLDGRSEDSAGTFSAAPRGREDFPLNRVRWATARDMCRFRRGDLPTEAQWERAASFDANGKRVLPWSDAPVDCASTVAGRDPAARVCPGAPLVAVTSPELVNDVSALGIVGLAGSLSELVLGSPARYDDACFRGASVVDPVCLDETLPGRVARGGEWRKAAGSVVNTTRLLVSTHSESEAIGFRCAYPARPVRR